MRDEDRTDAVTKAVSGAVSTCPGPDMESSVASGNGSKSGGRIGVSRVVAPTIRDHGVCKPVKQRLKSGSEASAANAGIT